MHPHAYIQKLGIFESHARNESIDRDLKKQVLEPLADGLEAPRNSAHQIGRQYPVTRVFESKFVDKYS